MILKTLIQILTVVICQDFVQDAGLETGEEDVATLIPGGFDSLAECQ